MDVDLMMMSHFGGPNLELWLRHSNPLVPTKWAVWCTFRYQWQSS